ncbi:MAG: Calcineurin-like phosphoesterase superfamily domain protein [Candidatus Bathyarchaeota archaeon BA1]|nr:MAG: Calcineurin-like phosphoesterase superfamily domain protein [Candidatus Bathyarchaeota archaeon BA1]
MIGDFHIPSRAKKIPEPILERMREERFDLILCTGDLTDQSIAKLLMGLGELHIVCGNMDYITYPEECRVKIDGFIIGLIHGDIIYPRGDTHKLAQTALRMGVNILISGHTHRPSINEVTVEGGKRVLLLNPGSATGVWSGGGSVGNPSFIMLKVRGNEAIVKVFELRAGRLGERHHLFKK